MTEDERLEMIRKEIERIRKDERLAPYLDLWDGIIERRKGKDYPIGNPPFTQTRSR